MGAGLRNQRLHCALPTLIRYAALSMVVLCMTGCPPIDLSIDTPQIPATTLSNTTCLSCHNGVTASNKLDYNIGVHRTISCTACHGGGLAHVRNGGRGGLFITNPNSLPFEEIHTVCADCHEPQVEGYLQNLHFTTQAVSCNGCHDVHTEFAFAVETKVHQIGIPAYVELCGSCHEEQTDDFLLSGHAEKNATACDGCHELHTPTMFLQSPLDNSTCLQCHSSDPLTFDSAEAIAFHIGEFHPVDPLGTGSGRCVICHLPPKQQVDQENGPHSHTFDPVAPIVSNDLMDLGVNPVPPNSCAGITGCHDVNTPGSGMPYDVNNPQDNLILQEFFEQIGELDAPSG